ncbi:MAG: DinB family protein [Acidobacteriota bacterium]
MEFHLDQATEILSQTPAILDALLRHKSHPWLNARKSPEAFSAIDVVGHLILAETTNWLPRIRIILGGDLTPFPPFDRFDFQPIIANKSIAELLDEFAQLRQESLATLASFHLTDSQLDLPGTHPQFGPITLRQQLATWAVHDLGHTNQIVKTLAAEYREAVGPWQAYLSILH